MAGNRKCPGCGFRQSVSGIYGGSFCAHNSNLEHDPEKWEPVFPLDKGYAFGREIMRKPGDGDDPVQSNRIMIGYSAYATIKRASKMPYCNGEGTGSCNRCPRRKAIILLFWLTNRRQYA
jgi:hypothetical protein